MLRGRTINGQFDVIENKMHFPVGLASCDVIFFLMNTVKVRQYS